jgi:alpha-L-fucosidase 2
MHQKLWYREPASDWSEGLPVGTGRLAAMVLGTCHTERLALNHEWLWEGTHRFRDVDDAAEHLPEVRRLLLAGEYERGTELANRYFGGPGGMSGTPNRVDSFQTAGDLYAEFIHGPFHDYRRELDLESGFCTVEYGAVRRDRGRFRREVVAHLTEDRILSRYTCGGHPFTCTLWLDRIFDPACALTREATPTGLRLHGEIASGMAFEVRAAVHAVGGEVTVLDGAKLAVSDATELLVSVDIGTSAQGRDPAAECASPAPSTWEWGKLLDAHRSEHARHYGGFQLDLPFAEPDLPTDERLRRLRAGEADPGLALLYVNYGRYLLCASSANASLPATLQGRWCQELAPPWNSDLHQDVNIQMAYWCAEPGGLQAYTEALLQHTERQVPHGREAARKLYGCDGVWFPIQTDPWGRCTPESCGWAVWTGAAAWLSQHMWWHYEFEPDAIFLRERCYPLLKEVAAFYESYIVEGDDGGVLIVPSQSPENRFRESGSTYPVSICVNSAMDIELARDALSHAVAAAEILDVDADRRLRWQDLCDRLPPLKIGTKGQLLEWNDEFEEVEPGHRHISHLYALYPGDQIGPRRTPELFAAAMRSLELRLESKGGHTGWSRAWTACCFARAGRGDEALSHVEHLVTDFATDSLLDLHPPRTFQIDGNLGGVAAVLEMLIQSYHGEIHLLPGLPARWPSGRVRGLRARGGFSVDIEWSDGRLVRAGIQASCPGVCKVVDEDCALALRGIDGSAPAAEHAGGCLVFELKEGETVDILPAT